MIELGFLSSTMVEEIHPIKKNYNLNARYTNVVRDILMFFHFKQPLADKTCERSKFISRIFGALSESNKANPKSLFVSSF